MMPGSRENNVLTIDQIEELWSKTYNSEGEPDWSHIFPFYHEDIVFQDSIQRIEGKDEFKKMCERLAKRCKSLEMSIYSIMQNDNIVMMEWRMTMSFRFFPAKPIYGTTRLTFNTDGQIIFQRDYYDLWGDIMDGIPMVKPLYRWFMHRAFG